jgi:hypothetical protein
MAYRFPEIAFTPANRRSLGKPPPLSFTALPRGGPQTRFVVSLVEVAFDLVASSFVAPTSLLEAEAPGSCFLARSGCPLSALIEPLLEG